MVDKTIEELIEENTFLKDTLNKMYGIESPFICGGAGETGEDHLPEFILVCPALGADGFATYKKYKDYSAPSY